jgi:hypothetical protein
MSSKVSREVPGHDYISLLMQRLDPTPDEGEELSNVVGREKAEGLLKWMGRSGWRPLDEALKEVSDPLVVV